MKELKSVVDRLISYFELDDIGYLGEKMMGILFSEEKNKVFDEYVSIVEDMEIDWIQKIFQYYKSNREELNQDYTPASLAKLLANTLYFEGAETCYDACSGSGSLVIQLHKLNPNMQFVCQEFDANVLPYLLFNLSIRNIASVVIHGDIIENKHFGFYKIEQGIKYGNIERINHFELNTYDIVTSNPPFNIKGFSKEKEYDGIKSNKSSNVFFFLHCLQHTKRKAGLILPTGFNTAQNKEEQALKQLLIEKNLLDSCISNPGKMFESTPVNTSIIIVDKNKKFNDFVLVSAENESTEWVREQRGQFGGTAHTNRVYKKSFNMYSDENISNILHIVNERTNVDEVSVVLSKESLKEKNYSFNAGQYFEVKIKLVDITQEQYENWCKEVFTMFDENEKNLLEFQKNFKSLFIGR